MKAITPALAITSLLLITGPPAPGAVNGFIAITNPASFPGDAFGFAVAGVGADHFVVGAYLADRGPVDAGAAFLYDTTGNLVTRLENPVPAEQSGFGVSVAAVGSQLIAVGAHQAAFGRGIVGAAYVFDLKGTLLLTLTNPVPVTNEAFGVSVAGVGDTHIVVGAHFADKGATNAGAAYLFDLKGTLVTTFTNPSPRVDEYFGFSVAGVGSDTVLIGAPAESTRANDTGQAYLFNLQGNLLTTFNNPSPQDFDTFGYSVAAVGGSQVIIGAPRDSNPVLSSGSAYLFDLKGGLITTYRNPAPAANDLFGWSVAGVGNGRVVIGAMWDDGSQAHCGAAYLFDTQGTRLATFDNPAPSLNDRFGAAVASVGSGNVLIGAQFDAPTAIAEGSAYLFSIDEDPKLTIERSGTDLRLSWPRTAQTFQLEEIRAGSTWTRVPPPYETNGARISIIVRGQDGARSYRLRR